MVTRAPGCIDISRLSKIGLQTSGPLKYANEHYGCPVVTRQEQHILFNDLEAVQERDDGSFEVAYSETPQDMAYSEPENHSTPQLNLLNAR